MRLSPNGKDRMETILERVYDFGEEVDESFFPDPDDNDPFEDFRFEPREGEMRIIREIQRQIEKVAGHLFEHADDTMERFYESVRAFEIVDGERVYRQYEDGRYVEDWARLSKQAAEQTVWDLQRAITELEKMATDFEMRMKFAYIVWDDEYQSAYKEEIEGIKSTKATIGDKTAHARTSTVEERHYYLFTYWTWRAIADKIRSLGELQRRIEFKLNRDSRDAGPISRGRLTGS